MSDGEIILYNTEDGQAEIQFRAVDGTVWVSQLEMAELFQTTKQNISLHVRNILAEGELDQESTVKEYLTVQAEGKRQVKRSVTVYRLEMILAVGYRVRSPRGIQFRRWATSALKEYLVKGFVMNDERLKDPAWDYFDELLERIRDIRASEARFYQKVRDILALSEDYDAKSPTVNTFYATIQNKMLYAVTSHTAGELIRARANPDQPNMGLTTWKNADKGRPLAQVRRRHGQELSRRGRDPGAQPHRRDLPEHRRVAGDTAADHAAGRMGGGARHLPDLQRAAEAAGRRLRLGGGREAHRSRSLRRVRHQAEGSRAAGGGRGGRPRRAATHRRCREG